MSGEQPEMLSEDRVRELMHRAADTVEFAPHEPFAVPTPTPTRRAWWPAAVAAVLVLAMGGGALVRGDWLTATDPGPRAAGLWQVPSVFAYDADSARSMLAGMGFDVEVRQSPSCEPSGRALGTQPALGKELPRGARVVLEVAATSESMDCFLGNRIDKADRGLAWAVLDFANGRGKAPTFADEVELWLDGERTIVSRQSLLSGASDPARRLFETMADATRATKAVGGELLEPSLTTHIDDGADFECGGAPPAHLQLRTSLFIDVEVPTPRPHPPLCTWLNVFTTAEGRIDALVLRNPQLTAVDRLPVPDVTGLRRDQALSQVRARGFGVSTEELEGRCAGSFVVEQEPAAGDTVESGSRILLMLGIEGGLGCHDFGPADEAVRGLPAFAEGDLDAVEFAPEIVLSLGDRLMKTITADEALDPRQWELCAAYAQRSCPLSALDTLLSGGPNRIESVPTGCAGPLGSLPRRLRTTRKELAERTATIESAGDGACSNHWSVQIWVTTEGRLRAVNLLLGDP